MSSKPVPLDRLVALREKEVDRLSADFAAREAMRQRYLDNLARMRSLCEDTSAGLAAGKAAGVLALNNGAYKQTLLAMVDAHAQDLAAHEAQMDVARQALHQAARGHEVLRQVAEKQSLALLRAQGVREQKVSDDLASQVWLRGRAS